MNTGTLTTLATAVRSRLTPLDLFRARCEARACLYTVREIAERVSSAASTSAYSRAGARMKVGLPVDRNLAIIEPSAPLAQDRGRHEQRVGLVAHAHPAPVQHLHMHRPKRLDGARAHVCPCPETRPRRRLAAALLVLLKPIFPVQFAQFVGMFAGFFDADKMLHPASECPDAYQKNRRSDRPF